MAIRILLVDDHGIMRDGLRAILEREMDATVVGEADGGREALHLVKTLSPEVVIMDIGMRGMNGIEATRQIRASHPRVRVIALSTYSDKQFVLEMLAAGASGYVVKATASDEVVQAVKAVSKGKTYLCPDVAHAVVTNYTGRGKVKQPAGYADLGEREREVLQLLAEGMTSKEIADSLCISVKTVEAHRRNITDKLKIHGVAELTKYAVRAGLTSLET